MALTWTLIFGYLLMLLVIGNFLPMIKEKRKARGIAWIIVLITVVFSTAISSGQAPLVRMLITVVLQLVSMKIPVAIETYSYKNQLTTIQWTAFCLGWFGMRPIPFERLAQSSLPFAHLLWKGISRIVVGLILLHLSRAVERNADLHKIFIPELLLLIGISLILHFGVLNLSASLWRMLGVNVSELFRSPYKSKSLKEFWSMRWNLAFSEMTTLIAFRPLKKSFGKEKALIVSFLLSGLLHEIAISIPVRAGFGLPMMYFVIHAFAMYLESHAAFIQRIIQHRWWSHVWVMSLIIIPIPLLFHLAFMQHVLMPLRNLILHFISFV